MYVYVCMYVCMKRTFNIHALYSPLHLHIEHVVEMNVFLLAFNYPPPPLSLIRALTVIIIMITRGLKNSECPPPCLRHV